MACLNPIFGELENFDARTRTESGDELRYNDWSRRARVRDLIDSDAPIDSGHIRRRVHFIRGYTLDDYEKDLRQGLPVPRKYPCRKCLGCRLDHAHEWADRLLMELPYHESSWFLTLTYDDAHLPKGQGVDPGTGEIVSCHATLVKSDLQKFLKRLRFNTGQSLRYYVAGEYGSKTLRPHYHIIVYGLHLNDLSLLRTNFDGSPYYTSDLISQCWPNGYHVLGKVTWESAAYVARYTLKKAGADVNDNYYEYAGIEPEFQSMSLRPGIGYQFYLDHPDFFDFTCYNMTTPNGGRKVYPPAYFVKLRKRDSPSGEAQLYDRSERLYYNALEAERVKVHLSDQSLSVLSADQERRLEKRLSGLVRDTI